MHADFYGDAGNERELFDRERREPREKKDDLLPQRTPRTQSGRSHGCTAPGLGPEPRLSLAKHAETAKIKQGKSVFDLGDLGAFARGIRHCAVGTYALGAGGGETALKPCGTWRACRQTVNRQRGIGNHVPSARSSPPHRRNDPTKAKTRSTRDLQFPGEQSNSVHSTILVSLSHKLWVRPLASIWGEVNAAERGLEFHKASIELLLLKVRDHSRVDPHRIVTAHVDQATIERAMVRR